MYKNRTKVWLHLQTICWVLLTIAFLVNLTKPISYNSSSRTLWPNPSPTTHHPQLQVMSINSTIQLVSLNRQQVIFSVYDQIIWKTMRAFKGLGFKSLNLNTKPQYLRAGYLHFWNCQKFWKIPFLPCQNLNEALKAQ